MAITPLAFVGPTSNLVTERVERERRPQYRDGRAEEKTNIEMTNTLPAQRTTGSTNSTSVAKFHKTPCLPPDQQVTQIRASWDVGRIME